MEVDYRSPADVLTAKIQYASGKIFCFDNLEGKMSLLSACF
jgi:hypothetical protein